MSKYFFLHIPKTAGTSFRYELANAFGQYAVFPKDTDLLANRGHYPPVETVQKMLEYDTRPGLRFFMGHYSFQKLETHISEFKKLVFLREPFSRALSNLSHLQRHFYKYQNQTLEEIAGLANRIPNSEIVNQQVRMLRSSDDSGEKGLEEALKNIEKFDFIGLSEEYEKSIELCNKTFGWQLNANYAANKNPNRSQKEDLSAELIDFINEHTKLDQVLYNKAQQLFKNHF